MTTRKLKRKPLFDAVRRMLGRGFRPREVARLDAAIDLAIQSRLAVDAPTLPESSTDAPSRTSEAGIALIHAFEGFARVRSDGKVEAYPDPGTGGAPWTIGRGSTRDGLFGFVRKDTVWTKEQCDERFADDLRRVYERDVKIELGDAINTTSQAQFDALVSFHFNTGAIRRATLTKKHIAGDYAGAANEFKRWNRAGGRVLKGLALRREAEADLYRSGI